MRSRIHQDIDEADAGFTLVELLVVIIIIGILAAIAIPIFLNQRAKAVEASQKSDLRSVAKEMESYFVDASVYPGVSQAGVTVTVGAAPDISTVTVSKGTSISTGTAAVGSFCLIATNTGSGKAWYFDSDAGGLNNTGCA